jgi:predicted DNA-binding protein (UPF0251 family)
MLERGDADLPAAEPAPRPDHADDVVLSIDVQRALMQVPEDFRAVMVLHDVQDLPQEEIAAILGIAVGTVKSRLHRGRIALARALGAERVARRGTVTPTMGHEPAELELERPQTTEPAERERPRAPGPSDGAVPR